MPHVEDLSGDHGEVLRARQTVEGLLRSVPAADLTGLAAIRLRTREDLSRTERLKRQKAGAGKRLLGTYYRAKAGRMGASIDLFVDEIEAAWPFPFLLRLRLFRELALARVLYHEIGHHLDARVAAGVRSAEGQAERHRKRLTRAHFSKEYPALKPLAFLVKGLSSRWRRSA